MIIPALQMLIIRFFIICFVFHSVAFFLLVSMCLFLTRENCMLSLIQQGGVVMLYLRLDFQLVAFAHF